MNNKSNNNDKTIHFCKYCRGQVWWETDVPYTGTVQSSNRPVLIISDNTLNSTSGNVIVLPMTSKHKFDSESNFILPFNEKSSIILGDQPRTVPKENLKNYIYTLSPELVDKAIDSLLVSIGLKNRTKGIRRIDQNERNEEFDSEKTELISALHKEKDIIEAYIDGGIENVTSVIGTGVSTAYKRLNTSIERCKACEVHLDLVKAAEDKKASNIRSPKILDKNIIIEKGPQLSYVSGDQTTNNESSTIDKTMIYNEPDLIKRQINKYLTRGEMTAALREFKRNGHFLHPGSKIELEGEDKFNYLQTLLDIVNSDQKLKRDIKKINTSLVFKIKALKGGNSNGGSLLAPAT